MTDNFEPSDGRLPRSLRGGRNADADSAFARQDPVFDETVPAGQGPQQPESSSPSGIGAGLPPQPNASSQEQGLPAFHSADFDLEDGRRRLGRGVHASGQAAGTGASAPAQPAAGEPIPFQSGPTGADFSYALPQAEPATPQAAGSRGQAADQARQTPNPSLSDEEVPNQPGAILKHARQLLGLSQQDIAMRLRLRVNSINDIENDRLNQPTAAAFVRGHIANYARLVNIDPQIVVELYDHNVKEVQKQAETLSRTLRLQRRSSGRRKGSRFRRIVYILLFVLIAGALLLHYLYTRPVDQQHQEVIITADSVSGEVSGSIPAPAVEGSLNLNQQSAGVTETSSKQPQTAADLNTRKAEAQASALGTNELTAADIKQPAAVDTAEPLLTSKAAEPKPAPAAPAAANQAQPQPQPAAQTAASAESTRVQVVDSPAGSREGSITLTPAPAPAAEPEPAKPALASTLRDISSRVRVEGRDGLASLNSAQITVSDEVFLRVTDQRGKVLASGNYGKGSRVSITGIPPIRIEVTDSARISVSYMGGRLITPRERQVSFVLPQR